MPDTDAAAAQELLRDSFTRLIEHVDNLTDGLTDEVASYRVTPQANSIAWLIWHSARVQDVQICDIATLRVAGSLSATVRAMSGPATAGSTGSASTCRAATPATGTALTTWPRCGRRPNFSPATTTPCTR